MPPIRHFFSYQILVKTVLMTFSHTLPETSIFGFRNWVARTSPVNEWGNVWFRFTLRNWNIELNPWCTEELCNRKNVCISKMESHIFIIAGIKYNKSTIRNQSILKKYISSLMGPKTLLVIKKHVLKMVDFSKPVN